jgi:carboxyl-terminal processing protease
MTNNKITWFSGFVGGIAAAIIVGGILYYSYYGVPPFSGNELISGEKASKVITIEKIINRSFLEGADKDTIAEGMYEGMLESLEDRYSVYYSADDYKKVKESSEGKYVGIGLVMLQNAETKELQVMDCYEGSPAAKAGVLTGDLIVEIQGKSVEDMDLEEAIKLISNEEGDTVKMVLKREGEDQLIEVSATPETVDVQVVNYRELDDSMGYMQITNFTESTSDQFAKGYQELQKQGIKGLIVDLRENPGGLLTSVCDTLEQILPEGMIVYTEDKNGKREEHTCKGETPIQIPLVVLVNENSASASEIFAGAVKDHGIGTLVGTTTFGKGIVQKIYPLSDGSAVKLTVSKYYTPNGSNIHGTGITPDVEEEWKGEDTLATPRRFNQLPQEEWLAGDNQMEKSLEILSSLVDKQSN